MNLIQCGKLLKGRREGMKIKTRLIEEGDKKTLKLECPSCKAVIQRTVDKVQLSDEAQCDLCGSDFFWSIQE